MDTILTKRKIIYVPWKKIIVIIKDDNLIDVKEKRIFELSRLIKILNNNNNNVFAIQDDAYNLIKNGGFFVSRCFISSEKVINSLKTDKNTTYLVSSNGEDLDYDLNLFHVKHENFKINKDDIRHIDVINVKWKQLL